MWTTLAPIPRTGSTCSPKNYTKILKRQSANSLGAVMRGADGSVLGLVVNFDSNIQVVTFTNNGSPQITIGCFSLYFALYLVEYFILKGLHYLE